MNTTKIHIISKSLQTELKRSGAIAALQQAVNSLQQLVRQPQQGNHQQQLSNALTPLYKKLDTSPINEFSPAWRDAIEEMGIAEEFGLNLKNTISQIIERNQITYQVAYDELSKVLQRLQQTEANLNGIVQGLEYFAIGEDKLAPNECEIGVIVPRKYVDNNLRNFGKELVELEKTLLVFSELSTGSRTPLEIRTISSSELSVFLEYIPQIGACIAIAVERIVALYKQMLEIKKLKAELVKQEVPEEKLQGINDYAESIVNPKIDEIAEELLAKYGSHIDANRRNEVSTELKHSLKKLADRIDRGFNVELRVAPVKSDKSSEDKATEEEVAIQQILDSAKSIDYSISSGEPVLFLTEDTDEKEI